MSKKRKQSLNNRTPASRDSNSMLQLGAGLVILLVIGGIIWAIVSSQPPARPPESASGGAATSAPAAANEPAANEPASDGAEIKQYDAPPPMTIDPAKKYTATVKMAKGGEFVIDLYADKAPKTVNSFVFLAREGYFDGVTFHRVLEGFMAQGGDPTGTGTGGPGYLFENEDSDLTFDKPGVVAMANAGRDTNGSQFFITFSPVPRLNGGYTIFGQVTSGMDVVNGIRRRDPEQFPDYEGDAIETVTITEQ